MCPRTMLPRQCQAARALLRWTQERLAERSGVSVASIRNFERESSKLTTANSVAVAGALVAAGIEFIPKGVRLAGLDKLGQVGRARFPRPR